MLEVEEVQKVIMCDRLFRPWNHKRSKTSEKEDEEILSTISEEEMEVDEQGKSSNVDLNNSNESIDYEQFKKGSFTTSNEPNVTLKNLNSSLKELSTTSNNLNDLNTLKTTSSKLNVNLNITSSELNENSNDSNTTLNELNITSNNLNTSDLNVNMSISNKLNTISNNLDVTSKILNTSELNKISNTSNRTSNKSNITLRSSKKASNKSKMTSSKSKTILNKPKKASNKSKTTLSKSKANLNKSKIISNNLNVISKKTKTTKNLKAFLNKSITLNNIANRQNTATSELNKTSKIILSDTDVAKNFESSQTLTNNFPRVLNIVPYSLNKQKKQVRNFSHYQNNNVDYNNKSKDNSNDSFTNTSFCEDIEVVDASNDNKIIVDISTTSTNNFSASSLNRTTNSLNTSGNTTSFRKVGENTSNSLNLIENSLKLTGSSTNKIANNKTAKTVKNLHDTKTPSSQNANEKTTKNYPLNVNNIVTSSATKTTHVSTSTSSQINNIATPMPTTSNSVVVTSSANCSNQILPSVSPQLNNTSFEPIASTSTPRIHENINNAQHIKMEVVASPMSHENINSTQHINMHIVASTSLQAINNNTARSPHYNNVPIVVSPRLHEKSPFSPLYNPEIVDYSINANGIAYSGPQPHQVNQQMAQFNMDMQNNLVGYASPVYSNRSSPAHEEYGFNNHFMNGTTSPNNVPIHVMPQYAPSYAEMVRYNLARSLNLAPSDPLLLQTVSQTQNYALEEYNRVLQQEEQARILANRRQRPKKFKCTYCGVGFSNNGQLKGHTRIHTGERPFKCDKPDCDKAFTRNEELTRHKKIHTGLRPFPCKTCGKRFGRKDHLKKHERTHLQPRGLYAVPVVLPMEQWAAATTSGYPLVPMFGY